MFRHVVVVSLLVSGAAGFAGSASAAPPPADSVKCGYTIVDWPDVTGHAGVVYGGPIAAADPADLISMTCTIQFTPDVTHGGANDVVAVRSPETPGATMLAPAPVAFEVPAGERYLMCTEVAVNGVPYYWDDMAGVWSASPDVICEASAVVPQPHVLDQLRDLLCPNLAIVFPPDGDVLGIDCHADA